MKIRGSLIAYQRNLAAQRRQIWTGRAWFFFFVWILASPIAFTILFASQNNPHVFFASAVFVFPILSLIGAFGFLAMIFCLLKRG